MNEHTKRAHAYAAATLKRFLVERPKDVCEFCTPLLLAKMLYAAVIKENPEIDLTMLATAVASDVSDVLNAAIEAREETQPESEAHSVSSPVTPFGAT